MYWQNNQHKSGPPQNRFSPSSSNSCGQHGDMGNPFMSPMHRPRFQSSPRYQAQFGSPFPDPYRFPPGGLCPQRSPRYSPRYDCNYSSPESNMSSMDSPYYRGRKNRCMSRPQSENGRGRGNLRYPKDLDSFSSPASSDGNPGGSNDIRLYYNPDMLQDPWERLKPSMAAASSN